MSDYLCLILTPYGGGSYARGADRAATVRRAARIFKEDWSHLFKLKPKATLKVNVYQIGDADVWWDDAAVYRKDTNERIPLLGVDEYTFPR
jgi:arginase family enzyme